MKMDRKLKVTSTTKTLSDILGIDLDVEFTEGINKLTEFHKKYPDETTYSEGDDMLYFSSGDFAFTLIIDFDEEGESVYKTTMNIDMPLRTVFDSDWQPDIETAVNSLANAIQSMRMR
jgi:ppGpp synthetase/RelA/SpoT-type nucleotidyltranferase